MPKTEIARMAATKEDICDPQRGQPVEDGKDEHQQRDAANRIYINAQYQPDGERPVEQADAAKQPGYGRDDDHQPG